MIAFEYIGYAVALCTGWGLVLLAASALAYATNWTLWHCVETFYGGTKTFVEFRDWYHKNKKEVE